MERNVILLAIPLLLAAAMTFPVAAEQEETNINLTVNRQCQVSTNSFDPPGNKSIVVNGTKTTFDIVGTNQTDRFFFEIRNTGNRDANVTVNLTVTNESDVWAEGSEIGNFVNLTKQESLVNESYDPFTIQTTYFIPEGETAIGNTYHLITKLFQAAYEDGPYTGRLNLNYTCSNINHSKESSDFANFQILAADVFTLAGTGENRGGTRGDIPSNVPFPSRANTTSNQSSDTVVPRDSNNTGNFTTNVTTPAEPGVVGDRKTNTTIEREANRTGEKGQNVEGDNPQPGVTPEPEPEPDPVPNLEIDLEPLEDEYPANQTQFAPVAIQIENVGEETVEEFQVDPLIDQIRPGWQVRSAQIDSLDSGENVTREVFVRPPDSASPGLYVSPIVARNDENRLDIDYFTIDVQQADFTSSISIQEAPESLRFETNSSEVLPVLVENTGEKALTNVTARLQNADDCGVVRSSSVPSIGVNQSSSLSLQVNTTAGRSSCNSTLIVSSDEGAYAFSNIELSTVPDEGLIPVRHRVPFIAIAWTLVLAAYAVIKKRYNLEALTVKAPFIMLLMGETVIILYLIVNYYGIVELAFLPF